MLVAARNQSGLRRRGAQRLGEWAEAVSLRLAVIGEETSAATDPEAGRATDRRSCKQATERRWQNRWPGYGDQQG